MPQSSSPPRPPRGEEGDGWDFQDGTLQSAPDPQQQLQSSGKGQGEGTLTDGTDRSRNTDVDLLRLHLARFVATLPARWRSRQRVSALGLGLSELTVLIESIVDQGGPVTTFPDDFDDGEEEEEEGRRDGSPTLALLAFRGGDNDDGDETLLSALGAVDAVAPNFQILAACRDVAATEELASRLLGARWSWRPLSRGGPRGGSLLVQLFPRSHPSSPSSSSLLVASDYDHTLIDDNSDTLVVEALGASETLKSLWKARKPKEEEEFGWTEAVDEALRAGAASTARLGERDPQEVVLSSAASAPCSGALREALLSVCGSSRAAPPGSDLAIFSDANGVFIEEGLRGNGLLGGREELNLVAVATNPARFVDVPSDRGTGTPSHRRLALSRATARYGGHSCSLSCPSNLCKGQLLAKLLVSGPGAPYSRGAVYLGDGSNDVCPAVSCLGPLDAALVRERYGRDGKQAAFGAAVLPSSLPCSSPASSPSPPRTKLLCRSVVPWATQEEMAEALMREARERGGEEGCIL